MHKINMEISNEEIENIIVDSFEGGSTYWLGFIKQENPLFSDKPADEPISTWAAKLLLEGKTIHLFDREDAEEKWELTLEKLLNGIGLQFSKQGFTDEDDRDGEFADMVIQYALFGELVYG